MKELLLLIIYCSCVFRMRLTDIHILYCDLLEGCISSYVSLNDAEYGAKSISIIRFQILSLYL